MENLLKTTKLILIRHVYLHTSTKPCGKQSSVVLRKILSGGNKKKFYYNDTPTMPNPNVFSKGSFEGKHSGSSKRATVLNKLFMRHISDLMCTGECSTEILGHGIEINRVKVTPNYKLLKVYWIAKGTENDEVIEKVLQKSSGYLRHELSQLRIMGVIPIIEFTKDKHYSEIVQLDTRLTKADFGEDYAPCEHTSKFKTQLQLLTSLENNVKEKIQKLDKETQNLNDEFDDEIHLPAMPQNVLGLNHSDILHRIQKAVKKSEAVHRQVVEPEENNWVTFKVTQSINKDPVVLGSSKNQREAFKEFLQKRQILRKASFVDKNYLPDLEYLRDEMKEMELNSINNMDDIENSEDFLIEDDILQK